MRLAAWDSPSHPLSTPPASKLPSSQPHPYAFNFCILATPSGSLETNSCTRRALSNTWSATTPESERRVSCTSKPVSFIYSSFHMSFLYRIQDFNFLKCISFYGVLRIRESVRKIQDVPREVVKSKLLQFLNACGKWKN